MQLSDDISQIWVVAQEFPEGIPLDMHLRCSREQRELSADAA